MFVKGLFPQIMLNADNGGSVGGDQGGSHEDQNQNSNTNDNTNSQESNKNEDARKQENMIPKSRFDEVNDKFKEVKDQLDALLKEKQDKELEQKQKNGEFEELYKSTLSEVEALKQSQQRAQALEGLISEMVDAKLSEIPEELHEIIPDGMTPEQKLSWITKAQSKGLFGVQKQTNPKEDQPLGEGTNDNNDKHVDVSKMSAMELFMSAYGRKDK